MNSTRRRNGKPPAFALVVVLLLTTLMLALAQTLAVFAGTEGIHAARTGADLQHRMAAESFLLALPALRAEAARENRALHDLESYAFDCGGCHVEAEILPHRPAQTVSPKSEVDPRRLMELSRTAGLSAESVTLRPVTLEHEELVKAQFLWFDQLVSATQFEEIFRLRPFDSALDLQPRCWSDLVTFWGDSAAAVTHVRIATRMGNDQRQWFAACALNRGQVVVHYLGTL